MMFLKTTSIDPPDWRTYEPISLSLDKMGSATLEDDLGNISGPCSLYLPDLEESSGVIEALQQIRDKLDGLPGDMPKDAPLSLLPKHLEHLFIP